MKLNKFFVDKIFTEPVKLDPLNFSDKPLGNIVALVGKNGSGKTRILKFVENFPNYLSQEDLINDFVDLSGLEKHPDIISAIKNAKKNYDKSLSSTAAEAQKKTFNANFIASANQGLTKLKSLTKDFVKIVDVIELVKIKKLLQNNLTFEDIILNKYDKIKHPINEFDSLNSESVISHLKELSNDVISEEFDIFLKYKKNPQEGEKALTENEKFKQFNIFKRYVKVFLDGEFDYTKVPGNSISSKLLFNDTEFNLELLSPGQKSLFAYATLFYLMDLNSQTKLKDSIIIIDEIETHLHPEAQIKLLKVLKSIVCPNGQLWIATHSINVLSHLEYDQIFLVSQNKLISPSRTTPGHSFIELMGIEQHIIELSEFINSISEWAYSKFIFQCFTSPSVVFNNDTNDQQYKMFTEFIVSNNPKNILDFGAGLGRIGHTLQDDIDNLNNINYFAYEINEDYHPSLKKINILKKLYFKLEDLPKNYFDYVLMCNVLHEIPPESWLTLFNEISKILTEEGYLIIIEDRFLPKGENAHVYGYLILNIDHIQTLFGSNNSDKNVMNILNLNEITNNPNERFTFCAIRPDQLKNISIKTISMAINNLRDSSYREILKLRTLPQDLNTGRLYANYTQLYVNSTIAIEHMQTLKP